MSNAQEQFEKGMLKVEKVLKGLDAIDTGLMKTHELVGTVQWQVSKGFDFVADKLMGISDYIGAVRDDIFEAVDNAEKEAYGESSTGPVQDVQSEWVNVGAYGRITKAEADKTDAMSRDEKIEYVSKAMGSAPEGYANWADDTLTAGVNFLKSNRGL